MPPETYWYRLAMITPSSSVSRTFDSAFSVIAGAALRAHVLEQQKPDHEAGLDPGPALVAVEGRNQFLNASRRVVPELGTRGLPMRFDSKANGTGTLWQFVSKATRPKLPGGLLLSGGLSRVVSKLAESQHDRMMMAAAIYNLLNLLLYKLLDRLRCLKATVVAFIQDHR
jgi:hypothetical protein